MLNKIDPVNKEPEGYFDKIIGKVEFGMQLFGIPLHVLDEHRNKLLRFWSIGFGLASILSNIVINILAMAFSNQPKTTSQWNLFISDVNITFALMTSHLGLLIFTVPGWKELILALRRIDNLLRILELEDDRRSQKVFRFASILFLLMVIN